MKTNIVNGRFQVVYTTPGLLLSEEVGRMFFIVHHFVRDLLHWSLMKLIVLRNGEWIY